MTAESVSPVGEGHEAELMDRSQRFNLLDLRNTFRKLRKCKVRVGTYNRVRFRIKNIELIKRDPNGIIAERVIPRLERNDVYLNARTQFAVERLRNLVVKLDLDAEQSISTDPVTNEPVFDPNATVETDSVPTDTTAPPQEVTPVLINQVGLAQNLTSTSFQLCDPADPTVCQQVNVSPNTVVQTNQLNTFAIDSFAPNTQLQVFGHLDVNTDTIDALHVLQTGGRVSSYAGNFSGGVDANTNSINFSVTAGVMANNTYPVSLNGGPSIFNSAGAVLNADALGDGVVAEVIGILNTFGAASLTPAVIIVATP